MRKGDVINGYEILRDSTAAGGGQCEWSFARRDGEEYFIKRFLQPKYPVAGSPGSSKTKDKKLQDCRVFEERHMALMEAIKDCCGTGGNLIATIDFFRDGPQYYKVTEKVDVASLPPAGIARLPLDNRLLVLRTVSHSLQILHRAGIVHADIKPGNILIKKTPLGTYTTKLIDFDNSFFSGAPPAIPEDVVGDMVYYSPELAQYIKSHPSVGPEDLETRSDIFALGLVFTEYLTGSLPVFDRKLHPYPYVAALAGSRLRLQKDGLPEDLVHLVESMLDPRYGSRPTIAETFEALKSLGKGRAVPAPPAPRPDTTKPGLRGSLMTPKPPEKPREAPAPPSPPASKGGLRGTLLTGAPAKKEGK